MQHYKAIILVLASGDKCLGNSKFFIPRIKQEWEPMYPVFKQIWESYMDINPNIKVLFVYGANEDIDKKNYDLVYEDIFENNYPGMITKTLRAFDDINKNYSYDFLIRTNLSTFWDLNLLEKRLDKLPKQKCLTGTNVKMKDKENNFYHYIAGYDMVMSRDLIEQIIPYSKEVIEQKVFCNMEDLSLCQAFKKFLNIKLMNLSRDDEAIVLTMQSEPTKFNEDIYNIARKRQLALNADHFRVKTRSNRNLDKLSLKKLLYDVYEKTIL